MTSKPFSSEFKIAIIGAGNMSGAMLAGWLAGGFSAENVVAIDPAPSQAMQDMLAKEGVRHMGEPDDQLRCDLVLLAVKPQILETVLETARQVVKPSGVVVSVAAGKTIATMEAQLSDRACVRVMPNTPALVQRGSSVVYANGLTNDDHKHRISELLSAIGSVSWVEDEGLIDAVTALSGSGPAYAFYLTECMAKAGEVLGLSRELATQLALETVCGAGELMRQSDDPPGTLRQNVTSPNGTTQAALDVLRRPENGLEDLMVEAMRAAFERSKQLSGGKS